MAEMWFLSTLIVASFFIVNANSIEKNVEKPIKGAIGFPEVEENPNLVNKENRTPVFLPAMCQENELYYPGDQKDDWICDCRPGYLFHTKSNSCWPAFRQGPCGAGHYLLLPKDSVIPTCYINPCMVDNLVMWNGQCQELGSAAPCGSKYPTDVLWVNATNAELDCVSLNHVEFIPGVNRTPPAACLPGCKRSVHNKCVPA